MPKQIVVVGSINLDLVCSVDRFPAPGETVGVHAFHRFPGGKGANQAVAIARLDHPVSLVAKRGDDEFGAHLRDGLQSAGVEVDKVTIAHSTSSGIAVIVVDSEGQNYILITAGANAALRPSDLENARPLLRGAEIIVTQLEIPLETVAYLAALAAKDRIPLMLDPSPARELPSELLQSVTYLTPNESEACILSGCSAHMFERENVQELAHSLQKRGPRWVIIKMGRHGAYILGPDGKGMRMPAFKVVAVDSTAAGDAFNAGLAVSLMQGCKTDEAVRYASATGALSVTRMGAQPSLPTALDVTCFLDRHARGRAK